MLGPPIRPLSRELAQVSQLSAAVYLTLLASITILAFNWV